MGANISQFQEHQASLANGKGSQRDQILLQLTQRYDNLTIPQLREYLELLPSPMDFTHLEASFRINFSEYPHLKNRLKRCFDPLSPLTYLEKTIHLVYGSSNDKCRLLFHLFCHKCHFIQNSDLHDRNKSLPQFYMNFHEFQAAVDMLVKGRVEWVDHKDRFDWLFQIADEYKEDRIELAQFAKVITEHPHLSEYLKEMCVPLWQRELSKANLERKDSFTNLFASVSTTILTQVDPILSSSSSSIRSHTSRHSSHKRTLSSYKYQQRSNATSKIQGLFHSRSHGNFLSGGTTNGRLSSQIDESLNKIGKQQKGKTARAIIRDSMTQKMIPLKRISLLRYYGLGASRNSLTVN